MRAPILGWFIVVGLFPAGAAPLRGNEQAEAKAVVDRAIQAVGGQAKLAKLKGLTWKSQATVQANGNSIPFRGEWSVQALDQFHWAVDVDLPNNNTLHGVVVVNGTKGWLQVNNQPTADMTKEIYSFLRQGFQAVRVAQDLSCVTAKGIQLAPLGELQINHRPAVGVKVTRKDQPDLDLFFDKETMLPVKSELRVQEPQPGGQEATYAFFPSDYQEVEGIKFFTKITLERDGQMVMEVQLSDLQPQESLDSSLFDKP